MTLRYVKTDLQSLDLPDSPFKWFHFLSSITTHLWSGLLTHHYLAKSAGRDFFPSEALLIYTIGPVPILGRWPGMAKKYNSFNFELSSRDRSTLKVVKRSSRVFGYNKRNWVNFTL
jgi:hypothetical protein